MAPQVRCTQPLAAEGLTREEAIDSMIDDLRLYSETWPVLAKTPEHARNWPLAQLIALSSDEQLAAWLERQAQAR